MSKNCPKCGDKFLRLLFGNRRQWACGSNEGWIIGYIVSSDKCRIRELEQEGERVKDELAIRRLER